MSPNTSLRGAVLVLGLAMAGLTGCGDDPQTSAPDDQGNSADDAVAEAAASGAAFLSATTTSAALVASAMELVPGEGDFTSAVLDTLGNGTCPIITYEARNPSFALKLDYGAGCTSELTGLDLEGALLAQVTVQPGASSFALEFDQFRVEDLGLDGTVAATTSAPSDSIYWSIDGTASQGNEWVTGDLELAAVLDQSGTPLEIADDSWRLNGGGTITTAAGAVAFAVGGEDPVVIELDCAYPVSGTLAFSSGNTQGSIDFGDGACDSVAMLTVGGVSWEIDLSILGGGL